MVEPTTDKVDYLQAIPAIQQGLGPARPWHNLTVMLNSHPVPLQPKFTDKLFQAGWLWK